MTGRLAGLTTIVTGASSGLGRHFALTLAKAGAKVAVAARRTDRLMELVEEIAGRLVAPWTSPKPDPRSDD